jgi:hypothetical protein
MSFFDLGDGPTFGNALERQREPGLRICVVHFRGLQEGSDSCPCPAAAVAAREQRVLARDCLRPDRPLDDVGVNINATVDEEAFKNFAPGRYASGEHPSQARWSAAKRLGSDGGLGRLVRLPIPGKKISDFVGRVIWKAGEHIGEPSLGIDVVHLAGLDQGIDGGGTISASI